MLSFDVVFIVVTETIIRLNPMTTQVIPTKAIAKRFMMLRVQKLDSCYKERNRDSRVRKHSRHPSSQNSNAMRSVVQDMKY